LKQSSKTLSEIGEQGKAWACELVQELLPYTAETDRVKELERENNELKEANNLLKIENIELLKENEILKMRNDLQKQENERSKSKRKTNCFIFTCKL